MAHWKSDGSPIGDFWVIDQDGWVYWAAPLNPGESTGLLLNKVSQTTQPEQYCVTLSKKGNHPAKQILRTNVFLIITVT